MAKVCRKKTKSSIEQTHAVTEEEVHRGGDQAQEYMMFPLRSGPNESYRAAIKVNGKSLSIEIDTGASVCGRRGNVRDHSDRRVNPRAPGDPSSFADLHRRDNTCSGICPRTSGT